MLRRQQQQVPMGGAGGTGSGAKCTTDGERVQLLETCGDVRRYFSVEGEGEGEGHGDKKKQPKKSLPEVQTELLTHRNKRSSSIWVYIVDSFYTLFLPEGYPNTVSPDYMAYQRYDTLQALCSSITGTLSTRSILRGVGVGEASATALSGTLQWVIRDGVGMVGRITFASHVASDLDNDAKRWRFVADITCDIALMLDVFSSHLPTEYWLITVCIAALFRAVTAVAGGATRASLTQHFAVCDNTADVSAKDGSQETAVNLIGMFLGMFVAWAVPETLGATIFVFSLFTILHLWSNYMGVRSLILSHVNEARANLCLRSFFGGESSLHFKHETAQVPTPEEVRDLEPIVTHTRLFNPNVRISIGSSLFAVLERSKKMYFDPAQAKAHLREQEIEGGSHGDTTDKKTDGGGGEIKKHTLSASQLAQSAHQSLSDYGYAVIFFPSVSAFRPFPPSYAFQEAEAHIVLGAKISSAAMFEAWVLAKVLSMEKSGVKAPLTARSRADPTRLPSVIRPTKSFQSQYNTFLKAMVQSGWRLDRLQLGLSDWRVVVDRDTDSPERRGTGRREPYSPLQFTPSATDDEGGFSPAAHPLDALPAVGETPTGTVNKRAGSKPKKKGDTTSTVRRTLRMSSEITQD